jgi:hypothetical protein
MVRPGEPVVDRFVADLADRGRIDRFVALLIIDEYIRFPAPAVPAA